MSFRILNFSAIARISFSKRRTCVLVISARINDDIIDLLSCYDQLIVKLHNYVFAGRIHKMIDSRTITIWVPKEISREIEHLKNQYVKIRIIAGIKMK